MALSNLFNRRARDDTTTANTTERPVHEKRSRARKAKKQHVAMDMSRRPPFGQWLKTTWLDIFTMAAMGMIGLGVRKEGSQFQTMNTKSVPGLHCPTSSIPILPCLLPRR